MDQKMISMKRSAADKKADAMEQAPIEARGPDYPYGLCIHMDGDELEKIGIKELPKIGEEWVIVCKCLVTRVSQDASSTREEYKSVDLQITDIGWEEED